MDNEQGTIRVYSSKALREYTTAQRTAAPGETVTFWDPNLSDYRAGIMGRVERPGFAVVVVDGCEWLVSTETIRPCAVDTRSLGLA